MKTVIKEVFAYRQMVASMVRRDLRGRYKGSFLGFLWNFLNPLLQLVVYTLIFTFLFKNNIPKFYLYVFTGLIPFIFFQTCLTSGCGAVLDQASLVTKVYYPREILPLSHVTSNFVNMLYCFVIVFAVYIFSAFISFDGGIHIVYPCVSPDGLTRFSFLPIFALPLLFVIEYILCLGMTLFTSAITVYVRDIKQVAGILGMVWMFATPVMWNLEEVSKNHHTIGAIMLYANPMTGLIESYHNILYKGAWPNFKLLIAPVIWAFVLLIIGYLVFEKAKKRFAEAM